MTQQQNETYDKLLAKIQALEQELATLCERVKELEDEAHETWMGGTC